MINKCSKILLASVLVILLFSTASLAEGNSILIKINGQQLSADVPPQVIDGRTMVPLRATVEALGADVTWNDGTKTITIKKGDKTIELTIAKASALINNNQITLDVPATIINGRTMVPLRFVSESLGANVKWDGETRTVTIDLEAAKGSGTPGAVSTNFSFLELNHPYVCPDNNMTITVKSINVTDKGGFYEYEIKYLERNNTSDKVADPGSFIAYFKTGDPQQQFGFFNKLYPGEENSSSFSFKALKNQEPYCIEYGTNVFFKKQPTAETLKWRLSR